MYAAYDLAKSEANPNAAKQINEVIQNLDEQQYQQVQQALDSNHKLGQDMKELVKRISESTPQQLEVKHTLK